MGLRATIYARQKAKPFVSTWKTDNISTGSSTATQVKLPTIATGTYNCSVDWGDGNITPLTTATYNTANTHTYGIAGTYNIKISGICEGWSFNDTGDKLKILSVQSWGVLDIGVNGSAFRGCANLTLTSVSDVLRLKVGANLNQSFKNCTSLTTINNINSWNLTNITVLNGCFQGSSSFNDNIGNWDVSNVTSFSSLNVGMFDGCTAFNNGGSSSINNWNTSNGVGFTQMFRNATSFNQPIGNWNVQKGTSFLGMFQGASAFNQNLGTWVFSTTTNFSLANIFATTASFNNGGSSSINNWNVLMCDNMANTFNGASAFNQPIGNWDIRNSISFNNFMLGKTPATFSAANLDAIYNGWSSRPVQPNLTITFGTAKYTLAGQAGRDILDFAPNNWTITDGGI